jgi:hypothetical protein
VDGIVQGARCDSLDLTKAAARTLRMALVELGQLTSQTACLRPAFECILKEMRDLTAQQLTCAVL